MSGISLWRFTIARRTASYCKCHKDRRSCLRKVSAWCMMHDCFSVKICKFTFCIYIYQEKPPSFSFQVKLKRFMLIKWVNLNQHVNRCHWKMCFSFVRWYYVVLFLRSFLSFYFFQYFNFKKPTSLRSWVIHSCEWCIWNKSYMNCGNKMKQLH